MFTGKKLLLIGMFLLLLIGIPVTIYILQQQTDDRTRAEKSTVLSYTPESSPASPIQKSVGDEFTIDLMVNPGTNLVSFVSFEIKYDPTILEVGAQNGFVVNSAAFPTTLEGPTVAQGKITGTLSVGAEPTRALQTPTKVGTITFKALKATGTAPTQVSYQLPLTKVLSIGGNDQFSEDVLASTNPAYVVILDGNSPSITPGVTVTPSAGPTPTPGNNEELTPTPTTPANVGSGNVIPVCTNLTVSPALSGSAPFSVNVTTEGSDEDGTVNKITYNFGDGQVADITDAGGAGTATVSAQTSYTYNTPGTYQVTSVLTDDTGGISTTGNCTQTVSVIAEPTPTPTGATPIPSMTPPGPGTTILGIGAIFAVITAIGSYLFFAL